MTWPAVETTAPINCSVTPQGVHADGLSALCCNIGQGTKTACLTGTLNWAIKLNVVLTLIS